MKSILSTFHAFLTLPNKTLKREKGTFFAVGSDVLISVKKEPLKINCVFKLYLKAFSNLLIDRCEPFGAISLKCSIMLIIQSLFY